MMGDYVRNILRPANTLSELCPKAADALASSCDRSPALPFSVYALTPTISPNLLQNIQSLGKLPAMPARRASAAAQNIASAVSRVHKSNGSNHSVSGPSSLAPSSQNAPYSSSSLPATPQQKVVYVLVNRLKSKVCMALSSQS